MGKHQRGRSALPTLAMTSGSGSATGSAHSTVTGFPQTLTLPLIRRRRACAADLWSSYSRKQNPRFFFLSSGCWYNITSCRPSIGKNNNPSGRMIHFNSSRILKGRWKMTCNFPKVFQYTFSCLVLWNRTNKQAIVCYRYANTQVLARADFVVITLKESTFVLHVKTVIRILIKIIKLSVFRNCCSLRQP